MENDDEPFRVNRGGGWRSRPSFARGAYRSQSAPGSRYNNLGVRLIRFVNPLQQLAEVTNDQQ